MDDIGIEIDDGDRAGDGIEVKGGRDDDRRGGCDHIDDGSSTTTTVASMETKSMQLRQGRRENDNDCDREDDDTKDNDACGIGRNA